MCSYVLKLADLGMARIVNIEDDYYKVSRFLNSLCVLALIRTAVKKQSDDVVPIRWQDPQAVASRRYDATSDVFSFGVSLSASEALK